MVAKVYCVRHDKVSKGCISCVKCSKVCEMADLAAVLHHQAVIHLQQLLKKNLYKALV
jgi:hypothetical protein